MLGQHKPQVGMMVLYYEGDHEAGITGIGTNGTRFHPAVVTRVWTDQCVNLQVFLDATGLRGHQSVSFLPDEVFAEGMHCSGSGWRFKV